MEFFTLDALPSDTLTVCHQCDLLVTIGKVPEGSKASCPRCGHVFTSAHHNALDRMLVFAVTALICLLFSNLFSFVTLAVQGQQRQITLLDTVQELFTLQEWALGAFILVIIIGLPTLFVSMLCWLVISIKLRIVSVRTTRLLRAICFLRFWNMAEIFFLGILVSMVKIAAMADLQVGASFWCYAAFNIFLIAALLHLDKYQLALAIRQTVRERSEIPLPGKRHLHASA
jgi:paraquat-inducible protein A